MQIYAHTVHTLPHTLRPCPSEPLWQNAGLAPGCADTKLSLNKKIRGKGAASPSFPPHFGCNFAALPSGASLGAFNALNAGGEARGTLTAAVCSCGRSWGPTTGDQGAHQARAPCRAQWGREAGKGGPLLYRRFSGPPVGGRGAGVPAAGEPTESGACWVPRVQRGRGSSLSPLPRWSPGQGQEVTRAPGARDRHSAPYTCYTERLRIVVRVPPGDPSKWRLCP